MKPGQALAAGLEALDLDLGAAAEAKLLDYLHLLQQWNRVYNLTAIPSEVDAVSVHLLDSLSILKLLPEVEVLDVGSGAGLPGIPLAVARPRLSVTMVEANGKKAAFIQHALARLRLANARRVQTRVEDWRSGERFRAIVSRAFAELATFVRLSSHLLASGGRLYAMKGRHDLAEASSLPAPWRLLEVVRLEVPGLDAERHLLVVGEARG
jgi:16S rRNA (guanine527-N7)-methyltransferase